MMKTINNDHTTVVEVSFGSHAIRMDVEAMAATLIPVLEGETDTAEGGGMTFRRSGDYIIADSGNRNRVYHEDVVAEIIERNSYRSIQT